MSAFGRYCCKSLSGYEARNIDSSAVFTWLYAAERTLRREPIQLTFATVPAPSRRHLSAERCPLQRVKRSFRWTSRWSQTDPNRTPRERAARLELQRISAQKPSKDAGKV